MCGDSFNLQHALSCPKVGLVITRHNELRNLTAEIPIWSLQKGGYRAVTYTIDGGRTSEIFKYEQPSKSRCLS